MVAVMAESECNIVMMEALRVVLLCSRHEYSSRVSFGAVGKIAALDHL